MGADCSRRRSHEITANDANCKVNAACSSLVGAGQQPTGSVAAPEALAKSANSANGECSCACFSVNGLRAEVGRLSSKLRSSEDQVVRLSFENRFLRQEANGECSCVFSSGNGLQAEVGRLSSELRSSENQVVRLSFENRFLRQEVDHLARLLPSPANGGPEIWPPLDLPPVRTPIAKDELAQSPSETAKISLAPAAVPSAAGDPSKTFRVFVHPLPQSSTSGADGTKRKRRVRDSRELPFLLLRAMPSPISKCSKWTPIRRMAELIWTRSCSSRTLFDDVVVSFPQLDAEQQRRLRVFFLYHRLLQLNTDSKTGFRQDVDGDLPSNSSRRGTQGSSFFKMSPAKKGASFLETTDTTRLGNFVDRAGFGRSGKSWFIDQIMALLCLTSFGDNMKGASLQPIGELEHAPYEWCEVGIGFHDRDLVLRDVLQHFPETNCVTEHEVKSRQLALIEESVPLRPRSSASHLGQDSEVARQCSPTALQKVDDPAFGLAPYAAEVSGPSIGSVGDSLIVELPGTPAQPALYEIATPRPEDVPGWCQARRETVVTTDAFVERKESRNLDVELIKPLDLSFCGSGQQGTWVAGAPAVVDDLLPTAHSHRGSADELMTARSHRGLLCTLLAPALSLGHFTAAGCMVDELLTARSDHVDVDFSFLATLAHSDFTEVASTGVLTPRNVEAEQDRIESLGFTEPAEMPQAGCGVWDSIDCDSEDAKVLLTSPRICERPSAIPKPAQAPVRAAPGTGLQERLQALAAAGLRAHAPTAVPRQESSDGGPPSPTTARSSHKGVACRKGSVGDDGSEISEVGGEAGNTRHPRAPKSQVWRQARTDAECVPPHRPAASSSPRDGGAQSVQPSAKSSVPSVRPGFADPTSTKISAEQLREAGLEVMVDPQVKEMYLSEDEFQRLFGMPRGSFAKMAKWKQHALKKEHGLF